MQRPGPWHGRGLVLCLRQRACAALATAALGLAVQALLYRGNEQALQAVQALEMGDYTLAVCFFKRALGELNLTMARLGADDVTTAPSALRYRDYALPRLFDLREIWLRVMNECRQGDGCDDSLPE